MTIRALIVDLDGTIVRNDGTVVPDIKEAFSQLSRMGIRIVIVSDRPKSEGITKIAGLQYSPDLFITRSEVGTPKGSPKWAEYVCDALTVEPRDLLYLGDTDHDMWTAVNSHILYLNAAWSNPTFQYGIQVSSPAMLAPLLENFFTKEALWYWTLDTIDRLERQVQAKTMIDGAGAGVLSIRYGLLGWTKFDSDSKVGAFKLGSFFMLHLLGSIYLDGLYESADWWTTYPGSTGKTNAVMDEFITIAAKLFRDKFKPGLLARHSPAVDSGQARVKRQGVTFMNQVNTVCLNDDPNIAEQIRGKSIVVIDDFVTEGYSSECARNLLLKAGAASVTTVAIGKYGSSFKCESPRPGLNWNPFVPNKLKVTDFLELSVRGSFNENALSCFRESYLETSKSGNKF